MRQQILYDYFYEKAYQTKTPVSVVIELTNRCNFRCEHCYLPSFIDSGMTFEEVKHLLHELKKLGVVNVTFTGGEIFMRRDIFQIIEVTRKLKMRVYLLSNASLITKEYAQILSDLKITEFSTTIFSMDETINDSITLKKGSLKMVLQGLENLKRNNIEVLIKTPVMQKNVINITDVKNFCDKNGFRYFASALIMGKSDGDQSTKNLRVKSCDFPNLVNKIDKLSGNREEEKHNVAVPCKPLHYSFSIDCKGNVYPCNSFYYKVGNIFNKSIYEIWYHSKEMEFIRDLKNSDLEKCNNCALYRYCDRCPGIVYQENKDMISCDQYAKSVAKVRMNNEISRQK